MRAHMLSPRVSSDESYSIVNSLAPSGMSYSRTMSVESSLQENVPSTSIQTRIVHVLTLGMSGMVDKLGGVALGATFGVAIAAAVVLLGAKIAYDYDAEALKPQLPTRAKERISSERLATVEESLDAIQGVLEESQAAAILVSVTDTLPESTLNMVPGDFRTALYIMRSKGIGKDSISILSPP